MNIYTRAWLKLLSIKDYYLFHRLGFPEQRDEKISKAYIRKFLPSKPVIIDCGAHDGSDSLELIKIMRGELHAFEPVDHLFEKLQKRTGPFPDIHCYKLALSNKTGSSFFYLSEGGSDASSSLLEPKEHLEDHPDTRFDKKIQVDTITLDEWARRHNVMKVDMLWLDMQGFELEMLKASKTILKTVSVIHTEVSTKETYKGVGQYPYYRQFLESIGFNVQKEAIPAGWDMGNVLFIRNRKAS